MCTHDLLPASLSNTGRASGILSTFTEAAGQTFNIRFLTVFRIFFLYCHFFFVCDVLQEILNGITLPVEVANRDIFSSFISASSPLFSQVFVCSAQTGWVVSTINFDVTLWFRYIAFSLKWTIQIFKNYISPFQARWSLERYYNEYYTIIVMVCTCQGLNIFGYDNAVIDIKTLSCNCKLLIWKDGFKCHVPHCVWMTSTLNVLVILLIMLQTLIRRLWYCHDFYIYTHHTYTR